MKLSIITVAKNNKAGLLRAIECVRNQTYKNVEHIIVDGGSTDGSVGILKQVQDDLRSAQNDSLLTTQYSLLAISEPDEGIYDAINKGIKLATGDVIGLLHSDDLFADENILKRYAEIFNSDSGQVRRDFPSGLRPTETSVQPGRAGMTKQIEAVYSDLVYVKKRSKVISQKSEENDSTTRNHQLPTTIHQPPATNYQLPAPYSTIRYWKTHKSVNRKDTDHHLLVTDHLLKNGWMPPHPTLFIRKEIFEKYGLYNTDLKIASDYEMILRLLYKYKITSYYLPITTYFMTIGGASNKSLKNILQKSKEDYLAMKMNGINFPVFTLISKNLRKLPQFLARD